MDNQSVSFRVDRDNLASSVSWVARSLPTKPAQPVLRGMLITAADNSLTLSGYDYEVSTEVIIPAEVTEPGVIAIAGKLLSEIVATLPKKEVAVTCNDGKVLVECGSSHFELPSIPVNEYPELPDLPDETGSVDANLFAKAVSQVATAAGRDETIPMLTGIFMEFNGSKMLLASTDRFRMAVRTFEWDPRFPNIDASFLIPAKSLLETAKTLSDSDEITLAAGQPEAVENTKLFGIRSGDRKTTTRLLDAKFPNFRPLMPKTHTAIATVTVSEMLSALKRVSLVTDRTAQIRLEFGHGRVILSAGGVEAGHAEEAVPCVYDGEPLVTAFNPAYLREGLTVVDSDKVVFGFTDPTRPVVMVPEPAEADMPVRNEQGVFDTPSTDFTYVLMPVRIPG